MAFEWFAGFSQEQKRRSIASMHEAARHLGHEPILEISSKSADPLGVALSAFNLKIQMGGGPRASVEAAYQGSKVYQHAGGPWPRVYAMSSRDAKAFSAQHVEDQLVAFDYLGERWPLSPPTVFYDWLYVKAVSQAPQLADYLCGFRAFSDIAFNPAKSIACQARSAALLVALSERGALREALEGRESFLRVLQGSGPPPISSSQKRQMSLF